MIDVRELRIGNYAKLGERVERVYQIIYDRTSGYSGKYSINHKDYNEEFFEPIELSEDILIKCGFEYIKNEEMSECLGGDMSLYKKNKIEIFLPEGSCNVLMNYEFENRVQYLHQLQNLFYCLTGRELEITL